MSGTSAPERWAVAAAVVGATLHAWTVQAEESLAVHRIGVLTVVLGRSDTDQGLRDGLLELGYIEGKNLVIEWRRSAANVELGSLATERERAKAEVIVAIGSGPARAAMKATNTPVVFFSGDPVATGLAASLAQPGGRATGVSSMTTEIVAKRLDFLHQLAPKGRRFFYLTNSSNPVAAPQLEEAQKAAQALGVQLVKLDARNDAEIDRVLSAIRRRTADGLLVSGDLFFLASRAKLARAIREARLPAVFPVKDFHADGALVSYGSDLTEVGRHMAIYVDKILKGAKPADLPIDQITKYRLIVDLREARKLGIDVPQELLLRADEVIR